MQRCTSAHKAFTLVELLVVIGIIAVLIGILLPVLGRAREAGNTIKCAANLRSIGQGIALYMSENKQTYPAAYGYAGTVIKGGIGAKAANGGDQIPAVASYGYIHWSTFLFGNKKGTTGVDGLGAVPSAGTATSIYRQTTGWDMFQCPSVENGGLPPSNTFPANLDAGQTNDPDASGNYLDQQAPRMAYTVNEALMGRNKYIQGLSYGSKTSARTYRFVRAGQVKSSGEVVLATEYTPDWKVVSGDAAGGSSTVVKSHRPVSGFWSTEPDADIYTVPDANQFGTSGRLAAWPSRPADVKSWTPGSGNIGTSLNRVGRNHGRGKDASGKPRSRSNFLYADGHVETKALEDTLSPKFEWGQQFYSLFPNGDISSTVAHP